MHPNDSVRYPLSSLAATQTLAQMIVDSSEQPITIALVGNLGSGKTQFVRFFAQALQVQPEEVTSPTYVLLQRYSGAFGRRATTIYHFDFYRLEFADQVWDLGIDEFYEQPVWILIEWADKFMECLPGEFLQINIDQDRNGQRTAALTAHGPRIQVVLQKVVATLKTK